MSWPPPSSASTRIKAALAFITFLGLFVAFARDASRVQTDYGRVVVTNDVFENEQGLEVRGKLFRLASIDESNQAPGVLFIHGYQSTRETGDSLSIEMARRGFVVLAIDTLGRGNSERPGRDPKAPLFDQTFGGRAALAHLRAYPFVKPDRVGLVGHSLGGEMSFRLAREDPTVRGLVIIGYAYTEEATPTSPKNMLMIIGQEDEFRDRMTGTRDISAEWMGTPQTRAAIPVPDPQLRTTYGDFHQGTARRVVVPSVIHIMEPHSERVVTEVLRWMRSSIGPTPGIWRPTHQQTWPYKERSTLLAMLACLASLLPLATLLLGTGLFRSVVAPAPSAAATYACTSREYLRHAGVNALLMWLYLPAALIIFAVHKYVVPVDGAFPMMVVNVIVGWFFGINVIGFLLFRRWLRRSGRADPGDLGISWTEGSVWIDRRELGKTALLGFILFAFVYGAEHLIEAIYIVDFRFIFAFASDLTPYRAGMMLLYLPPLLLGFIQLGFFLHGQLRTRALATPLRTFGWWTSTNLVAMLVPILLMLAVQYVPLMTTGAIPLVGPGGMFVLMMINLIHIAGVLLMIVPISTWCYTLTGRPYLGAILCALLVAWFFASSQVIAPVPID